MGGKIRSAKFDDLPDLLRLEQASFSTDQISRRSFRRWLKIGHDGLAIAEEAGRPCGYILLLRRHKSRVARLYSIAVAPDWLGRGLGRQLLAWADERACQWGAECLRLEVQPGNRQARALYERNGYRVITELAAYYEDGGDALRMEKRLAAPAA